MNVANKKILVTGGLGFIGSHVVESLVTKAAKVVVYDNCSSGSMDNLVSSEKDVETIEGDIPDYNKLKASRILSGVRND